MKLKVTGQRIEIIEPYLYVSDTENVYEVEYEFSEEWEGYSKTAVFHGNGYDVDVVLTENKCAVPNEVIAENGYIKFGVYGTTVENEITKRYPTVYSKEMWVDVGCKNGTEPLPPTPDVYAQILEKCEEAQESARDAELAAEEAMQSASEASASAQIAVEQSAEAVRAASEALSGLENKVDKEEGKGLSSNDFTDTEKEKLGGIEEGAEKNLPNTVVDENYVHTDNNYTTSEKEKLADLENYDDTAVKERLDDIEAKEAGWDAKAEISDITSAIATEDTAVKSWVEGKGYSLISETGYRIDLECDSSTYELKAKLYDKNNVLLSTSTVIDLPIESLIVDVDFDEDTKELIITLKSGATVRVPIGSIVSGLATQDFVRGYAYSKNDVYTKTEANALLDDKVDAEDGKGLSTNDYTDAEKTKLAGIEAGAEVNDPNTVIDEDYVHTDNNYSDTEKQDVADNTTARHTHSNKSILDTITQAMLDLIDTISEKYVKPLTGIPKTDLAESVQDSLDLADTALQEHQDISGKANTSYVDEEIARVEGEIPTVPTNVSAFTNDAGYLTEHQDVSNLQPKMDVSLSTSDKTVVGAINELLTKITNHIADAVKHITASERTTWNGKQDAISDLTDIRNGANAGATALQPSALNPYRTAADQNLIDASKLSDAPNDGKQYVRESGAWAEVTIPEVDVLTTAEVDEIWEDN